MHQEALKSEQKKIFEKLPNFPEYYLAGGTALALQIGHRISIDFNLFSSDEIPENFPEKVEKIFQDLLEVKIVVRHSEQVSFMVGRTLLSFIKYPFPVILNLLEYKKVKMLSVPEIGATKAYALGRRAIFKDYVDLFFIIRKRYSTLEEITNLAIKKFKEKFEPRLFYEQLIYLEDVEEMPIEYLKKEKPTKKEIQKFFEKEIKKLKLK
ncbi:MAG: nucleotidyl transferase AbiEii/AbiGii toxin family protein [Candidatus Pacebacteria bacterium]|nr:nucleotidyl transferase AbiEii/AbiGii toxin family protein [Candidatus Paceibacterota bacterium]